MKGLLVKELRFMLGQKSSFLIFVALGLFFLLTGEEVSFGVTYSMLMMSIFATNSIFYDSHENGMPFLVTLPIKRKYYVLEKYLFSFMMIVLMGVVMSVLTFGCNAFGVTAFKVEALKEALLVGIGFGMVMISVMTPILVIFGAEKARVVIVVMMGIAIAVYYVITKLLGDSVEKIPQLLMRLNGLSDLQTILLVGGILKNGRSLKRSQPSPNQLTYYATYLYMRIKWHMLPPITNRWKIS